MVRLKDGWMGDLVGVVGVGVDECMDVLMNGWLGGWVDDG